MKRTLRFSAIAVAILAGAGPAPAQDDRSIYPVYEGYVANDDGSYTLVFGYFNSRPEAVELEIGEGNAFDPGPADRGQPTRLLPGRQRNVCVLVVGPESTGNLRWTLGSGDERQSTTDLGGPNPLYLLESIGSGYRAARQFDPRRVERGVCLNQPPSVRAPRTVTARAGEAVELRGFVSDDGLPRAHRLEISWEAVEGPGTARFDTPDQETTRAVFDAAGAYVVALRAGDGDASREARVTVTVSPGDG